jgi:hypothetical protein
VRANRIRDRFRDGEELVEITRSHSLEVDHDSVISARVDKGRKPSRRHRRELRVVSKATDYLGMKTAAK